MSQRIGIVCEPIGILLAMITVETAIDTNHLKSPTDQASDITHKIDAHSDGNASRWDPVPPIKQTSQQPFPKLQLPKLQTRAAYSD